MEGYFGVVCVDGWTGESYDFLHQGTDYDGRKYALEAFKQLKEILLRKKVFVCPQCKSPPSHLLKNPRGEFICGDCWDRYKVGIGVEMEK